MAAAKPSFSELVSFLAEEEPVRVESYSGYIHGEKPQRVIVRENAFLVEKVLESKRILRADKKDWADIFICLVEGEKVRLERQSSGEWRIRLIK